jgi:hypothetical protein
MTVQVTTKANILTFSNANINVFAGLPVLMTCMGPPRGLELDSEMVLEEAVNP